MTLRTAAPYWEHCFGCNGLRLCVKNEDTSTWIFGEDDLLPWLASAFVASRVCSCDTLAPRYIADGSNAAAGFEHICR